MLTHSLPTYNFFIHVPFLFVKFQNEPTVEEVKKPEPVAQNELIDSGVIQMVVEFIKNIKKKPEFLLEIVLPMVEESGLVGKEVTNMAKIYGKSFVRSESFMYLIDSTADYIESVGKSPMGKKKTYLILKSAKTHA